MDTDYELTRLHRLTDDEADLILNFRLVSAENKTATSYLLKSLAQPHVEQTGGNVVGIRRPG